MPESRKRKKVVEQQKRVARAKAEHPQVPEEKLGSPKWWVPTMVTLAVIGLVIVVLAYIFSGNAPIPGFGNGNLFLGIGFMLVGFLMTMGWK